MTSNKLVKAVNFNATKINFSDTAKENKYKGKQIYANYDGAPLRVQLPIMKLPFGINEYVNPDKPDEIRYSLEMAFDESQENILNEFQDLEKRTIEHAKNMSVKLFQKQFTAEVLTELFKTSIRPGQTKEVNGQEVTYPSRFKAKIYTSGSNFDCIVYDSVKVDGAYPKIQVNEQNYRELIPPGSKCEAIVQSNGIWVVGKGFGLSWGLVQLKVYRNENKLTGYAFESDEEEDIVNESDQQIEETGSPDEEEEPFEPIAPKKKAPVKRTRERF